MSRRVMRGFSPDALRQARLNAGLSQTEIARVAKVGTGTVRRWEMGESSPPQVDLLARVVEVLGGDDRGRGESARGRALPG